MGYRYVHDAAQDPIFAAYLLRYMRREGIPTLPPVPGIDLTDYTDSLIERFGNAEVRDTVARLAAESSDRIPKWLVPVIKANLASGGEIDVSAAIVASWARYAEGVDEHGEPIEVVDRLAEERMAAAARQRRIRWRSSATPTCSATWPTSPGSPRPTCAPWTRCTPGAPRPPSPTSPPADPASARARRYPASGSERRSERPRSGAPGPCLDRGESKHAFRLRSTKEVGPIGAQRAASDDSTVGSPT